MLRILEIGAGTGKNVYYYPPGSQVTAIDLSPRMLSRAVKRTEGVEDVSIELLVGDARKLSFDDSVFDAVVGSFILTVLEDPLVAIQEIKRVCKPGAVLLLLEFTRSDNKQIAVFQDMVAPLAHAAYRAHIKRDLVALVRRSGYQVISVEAVGDGFVKILHAACRRDKSGVN